jgi:2-haloacid dehalogenase
MSSTNKTVIAFDLYGTLLSTESIAKKLGAHFGDEKAQSIAALWRRFVLVLALTVKCKLIGVDFNWNIRGG